MSTVATFVRPDDLRWHEECEPLRLERTVQALQGQAVREAVHVSSADGVILDGAHRCQAARLLGREDVPAHVVPMREDTIVPGWTHVLTGPIRVDRSPESDGPIIATVWHHGRRTSVRTTGMDPAHLWGSCWSLMEQYQARPYERCFEPSIHGISVQWHPPRWGVITRIVREFGALPPGVTRLGEVIAERCPQCRG